MVQCSEKHVECRMAEWLWKVVPLMLLIIGTGGNIVNIIVLSRRKLRRYSTSVYLLVLAVSDTLSLLIGVPQHTYNYLYDLDFLSISYMHCKFVSWIGISSSALSTWTVVNLTIERVLLTMYPIKAKVRLTPKVSVLVSMTTVIVIQIFTAHLLFSRTYIELNVDNSNNFSSCAFSSKSFREFHKTTWKVIVFICFNLLPIVIILTGNALIGTTLLKRKRQVHPTISQINLAQEKKAMQMLFAICSLYLIFTSPFCMYIVITANSKRNLSAKDTAVDQLVQAVLHLLVFSNFTFNFVLYFARGTIFREECTAIVTSLKKSFLKLYQRRGGPSGSGNNSNPTTDVQSLNVMP